jgi:hypothetical protein
MAWTTTTTRSSGFLVTAAVWNNEHVNNMQHLEEVAHVDFTADVSVTATTVATANQIVSAGALTYEAVPHYIEFCATRIDGGTQLFFLILRDATTVLGTLTWFPVSSVQGPVCRGYRLTPTAASHTYNVAGWNNAAATTTVQSGTGGAAGDTTTALPGYIRIWKAIT